MELIGLEETTLPSKIMIFNLRTEGNIGKIQYILSNGKVQV